VEKPIIVKTAGGAASQCLGLLSAIQVSMNLGCPFTILHYPYSTGAYYPSALTPLLTSDEESLELGTIKGFVPPGSPVIGKVILDHPLQSKFITYEKILIFIRRLRLEKYLKLYKKEWMIDWSLSRLQHVPTWVKSISGGYPPFIEGEAIQNLKERFQRAGLIDFIGIEQSEQRQVVIHYRIGDKRSTFSNPTTTGDGIIDPQCFERILRSEGKLDSKDIFVISDEPEAAVALLDSVGIRASYLETKSLWEDLSIYLSAELAIGPWSTVSQLSLCFFNYSRTKVYFPKSDSTGRPPKWKIGELNTYMPVFLLESHPIYKKDYEPVRNQYKFYTDLDDNLPN
jgi:hypothetical protein